MCIARFLKVNWQVARRVGRQEYDGAIHILERVRRSVSSRWLGKPVTNWIPDLRGRNPSSINSLDFQQQPGGVGICVLPKS
jgi:hypothetical protein